MDAELLNKAIATTVEGAKLIPEAEIRVIIDYCLAIETLLKRKSVYPLKPGGLRLYQDLLEIMESMMNCYQHTCNRFLEGLLSLLSGVLNEFKEYAAYLEISYSWIYKIAKKLDVLKGNEEEAKQELKDLLNSFNPQNDPTLILWLAHIKTVTNNWLPWLFKYLAQPLLPKTNNELETFNGKIKKIYRKITGRKQTQNFVSRFGVAVSILLSVPEKLNWLIKFSMVPYEQFRVEREKLAQKEQRGKVYRIRRDLSEFLFELEVRWSS